MHRLIGLLLMVMIIVIVLQWCLRILAVNEVLVLVGTELRSTAALKSFKTTSEMRNKESLNTNTSFKLKRQDLFGS